MCRKRDQPGFRRIDAERVNLLVQAAQGDEVQLKVLSAASAANDLQRSPLVEQMVGRFGHDLTGRHFAIWGPAFKPGADERSDPQSRLVIDELGRRGAVLCAFDPLAMDRMRLAPGRMPGLSFVDSQMEALHDADALLILNERRQLRSLDLERIQSALRQPLIFDAGSLYDAQSLREIGIEYFGFGGSANVPRRLPRRDDGARRENAAEADYMLIRGRRLDPHRHVDPRLFDAGYIAELKQNLRDSQPFQHLVVEGWFNPVLLELVREEFDLIDRDNWKVVKSEHECTHRLASYRRLGPASEIYFGIVNSGWFIDLLGEISGITHLLPDPRLLGGGLHETRPGGKFGIHLDFDRHACNGLDNRMVFITYLNRNWNADWGAALELWSANPPVCMRTIQPEFGTSVLMIHGAASFHGHPAPMTAPAGQTRRSVASYYYQNGSAEDQLMRRRTSLFLFIRRSRRLRNLVIRMMPPILLDSLKALLSR